MIMDRTEFKIPEPIRRMAARTCWSDYKSANSSKILATISPACALVWASTVFHGRISDLEIGGACRFMFLVKPGDCYLAYKGNDGLVVRALLERGATVQAPPRVHNRGVRSGALHI
jgi:hypothetical protein